MADKKSWIKLYCDLANNLSNLSYDPKTKVGCVVTSDDFGEIYALGINGGPKGLSNERISNESGKSGFLHAEINSLIKCKAPKDIKKIVFCTHSPCYECSVALINLGGVSELYYLNYYSNPEGIALLTAAGIVCHKV